MRALGIGSQRGGLAPHQLVSVEGLRLELERFAGETTETIRREFRLLREHLDETLKREITDSVMGCHSAGSLSAPLAASLPLGAVAESDASDGTASPRSAPDRDHIRVGGLAGAFAEPAGWRNSAADPLPASWQASWQSVRWATRRGSFARPDGSEDWLARRSQRNSRRGTQARAGMLEDEEMLGHSTRHMNAPSYSATPQEDMAVASAGAPLTSAGSVSACDPSICTRCSEVMEALVLWEYFDWIAGCVIILHAAMIGVETEFMAVQWSVETPPLFVTLDRAFCAFFILEIALRLWMSGTAFFHERGCRWNVFDLLVTLLQLTDEVLGLATIGSAPGPHGGLPESHQISTLRILRLFRLVRLLRLTRMLHLLGGLRMLVVSIGESLRSLTWTLFMLFVMTFVFAVFLTQLVTDHKVRNSDHQEDLEELLDLFGSLDRSMLCLYEAISEGTHWSEVVKPLMEQCGRWLALVFTAYMSFALFALMNVVTGVFCETAIRTAEEDKKHVLMQQMHELFLEADVDRSGTIAFEEFEAHLGDPQMLMYLKAIDVNPDEARHLFTLLDTEGVGEIEVQALVNGCLRLQGSAKAIELAAFMQEHKQGHQRVMDHAELVERSLSFLCENIASPQRASQANVLPLGEALRRRQR